MSVIVDYLDKKFLKIGKIFNSILSVCDTSDPKTKTENPKFFSNQAVKFIERKTVSLTTKGFVFFAVFLALRFSFNVNWLVRYVGVWIIANDIHKLHLILFVHRYTTANLIHFIGNHLSEMSNLFTAQKRES